MQRDLSYIEDGSVSTRHEYARVLGFSSSHAHIVRPSDCERGLNETLKESKETAETPIVVERREAPWCFPISEAKSIPERVASKHDDESEDDQPNDEHNLAKGRPELHRAIPPDSHQVDQTVLC